MSGTSIIAQISMSLSNYVTAQIRFAYKPHYFSNTNNCTYLHAFHDFNFNNQSLKDTIKALFSYP